MSETVERKKSPNLDLRGKVGMYVIGEFIARYESKQFPGKYSSLIKVEDTDGDTTLYNAEQKENVSVDIDAGDSVFLSETTFLATFLSKRASKERIKITYTGKGTAKKGKKAPFMYQMEVLS